MIKTKVAVIGGGPVGLFSSLLLQHFNIDHVTFEKFDKPRSHPSAHWISARSKQILSQIPNLAQKIDSKQQQYQQFKHYRYCQSLFGFQFGFKNHFQPSIKQKLEQSRNVFGQYPNHMSQAKLLQIMFENIKQKQRIVFDTMIDKIQVKKQQNGIVNQIFNKKKQKICQAEYVILANGFKSQLRDSLGIKMTGQNQYMNIINIHFESKKFAQKVLQKKVPAMLHFIYNKKLPSILVNHSYESGVFVLQVPNYEPFVDLMKVYTPIELISTILQPQDWREIQKDIKIIDVGKWKLQALLANKFRQQNTFLVGDTAHTYTPAGGFGMNSGFQDANQIIHFIDFIRRNQKCNKQYLLQTFSKQRHDIDLKYLNKSIENYNLTQQTAEKVIKYSKTLTSTFISLSKNIPKSFSSIFYSSKDSFIESLRLGMMGLFYNRAKFQPQLQLFYDQFDQKAGKVSKKANLVFENNRNRKIKDLYVDKSVDLKQIQKLFGEVKPQNIQFFQSSGDQTQKIIRRDGMYV